jgi:hypothetical protein
MPRNHVQRVTTTVKEQSLTNALAGLKDGTFVSIHQASKATGTPRITISRHMNGGLSKREAQHHRQILSPDEERALGGWVQRLSATGHPVHHSFLRELAEEIRKPHVSNLPTPVQPKLGKHWVSRFLARNPVLQSKLAKNIEAARKEVTEAQLENWFNEFKRVVDEFGILPENIYNMDETGSNS